MSNCGTSWCVPVILVSLFPPPVVQVPDMIQPNSTEWKVLTCELETPIRLPGAGKGAVRDAGHEKGRRSQVAQFPQRRSRGRGGDLRLRCRRLYE